MEDDLLETYSRIYRRVNQDSVAAAILSVGLLLKKADTKRTGLTTKEAAEYLGVSDRTIRNLSRSGNLRRQKVGRAARFSADDLDALQLRKAPQPTDRSSPDLRHFA